MCGHGEHRNRANIKDTALASGKDAEGIWISSEARPFVKAIAGASAVLPVSRCTAKCAIEPEFSEACSSNGRRSACVAWRRPRGPNGREGPGTRTLGGCTCCIKSSGRLDPRPGRALCARPAERAPPVTRAGASPQAPGCIKAGAAPPLPPVAHCWRLHCGDMNKPTERPARRGPTWTSAHAGAV